MHDSMGPETKSRVSQREPSNCLVVGQLHRLQYDRVVPDVSLALCDMERCLPARVSPLQTHQHTIIQRWHSMPSCLRSSASPRILNARNDRVDAVLSPTRTPRSPSLATADRLLSDLKAKVTRMTADVNRDQRWFESLLGDEHTSSQLRQSPAMGK